MSYFLRNGMGDGPVTSPSQVDPTLSPPIATVPPTLVDCSALPADSPFLQPGQVCHPVVTTGQGLLDAIGFSRLFSSSGSTAGSSDFPVLPLAIAGVAAYFLFRKKK